jgi:hypothetical protein
MNSKSIAYDCNCFLSALGSPVGPRVVNFVKYVYVQNSYENRTFNLKISNFTRKITDFPSALGSLVG